MAGGRPTIYKPEYCQTVKDMMREGAAIIEIAHTLDVSKAVLYDWQKKYPEFLDAFNEGRDLSEGWWWKQGRTNLKSKDFNSRLFEINMMNRHGWMKRAEGKHEVKVSQEDAIKELE